MDVASWQARLSELTKKHKVPGASLAVWRGGELTQAVTGVLNKLTGVEVTPDSLFQIGSITKVYTATLAAKLVQNLDTPVVELLPEFRLRDPEWSAAVTVRHLLTHSSGIDGDFFHDTGRGDDCVRKYVAACADLDKIHEPGATMSYSNSGFVIMGRIIEVLTGRTWDQALRDLLLEPAGLDYTVTLPEETLRFRTALGHLGADARPSPQWGITRAMGPAGLICASAADVVEFGRLHLDNGRGVLDGNLVAAMQQPQIQVPDGRALPAHWGLGWYLESWPVNGSADAVHRSYAHRGGTIGQGSLLYVLPEDDLVVVLLANGGDIPAMQFDVLADIGAQLGLGAPIPPAAPESPAQTDLESYAGEYERTGIHAQFTPTTAGLRLVITQTGPMGQFKPQEQLDLVALADGLFLGRSDDDAYGRLFHFFQLPDGSRYVFSSSRAFPRRVA